MEYTRTREGARIRPVQSYEQIVKLYFIYNRILTGRCNGGTIYTVQGGGRLTRAKGMDMEKTNRYRIIFLNITQWHGVQQEYTGDDIHKALSSFRRRLRKNGDLVKGDQYKLVTVISGTDSDELDRFLRKTKIQTAR